MTRHRTGGETAGALRDGDVLITLVSARRSAYEMHVVPGVPQIHVKGKEVAVEQACRFAREAGVDVWYAEGTTIVCVSRFRRR